MFCCGYICRLFDDGPLFLTMDYQRIQQHCSWDGGIAVDTIYCCGSFQVPFFFLFGEAYRIVDRCPLSN